MVYHCFICVQKSRAPWVSNCSNPFKVWVKRCMLWFQAKDGNLLLPCALHMSDQVQTWQSEHLAVKPVICASGIFFWFFWLHYALYSCATSMDSKGTQRRCYQNIVNSYRKRKLCGTAFLHVATGSGNFAELLFFKLSSFCNMLLCSP